MNTTIQTQLQKQQTFKNHFEHHYHEDELFNISQINNISEKEIKLNLVRIIIERGAIDCFEALFGRLPNPVELDS